MNQNNQSNQNYQNNYYHQEPRRFSGQYYQPPVSQPPFVQQYQLEQEKKRKQRNELMAIGAVIGCAIVAYLVIQVVATSLLTALGLYDVYTSSPVFQSCFGIIAVHICSLLVPFGVMALILKKKFTGPVIPTEPVKGMTVFSWVSCGMIWCLLSNIIVNFIINIVKEMGYELTQGEMLEPDSVFSCVLLVLSTAVIPGIVEEFAMRCCTLGVLKRYGAGFAVFAVSVVFGLLHGNVIQFVYAFLVGLFLAYVTINTGNIVPAMLLHGFANGLSVIQDVVKFAANEKTADNVLSAVVVFWFVCAVIGLIYLIVKKEILPKKVRFAKMKDDVLSFGEKLLCLIPGFFVPFVLLILLTVTTIHKI